MEMKGFGLFMVLIGMLILLSTFGMLDLSFGKVIGLVFVGIFTYSGVSTLVRKGFPRGLVSLAIAAILTTHLLGVYKFGFIKGLLLVIAIAFVEWGLSLLFHHKH